MLSTINHQPSTINHQPSTINHQPSTINHQNNQSTKLYQLPASSILLNHIMLTLSSVLASLKKFREEEFECPV
jgi:hypothetical protein